ncbi:MAG: hypothetical protein HFH43_01100 [Lachnospiraceae bacterium]|nr:hypothetical protein [Lachnospiraceae bacterium]
MGSGQYDKETNGFSVRIALGKELKGSGVLFLRQSGELPLLFTAAHVLVPFFEKEKCISLCLGCSDGGGKAQEMEVYACWVKEKAQASGKEGETYIHPQYIGKDKEYVYDVAIVVLPWKEWMKDIGHFNIKCERIGEELQGWGFPESADRETQKEHASIMAGKKGICGKTDNIEGGIKKFSVAYETGFLERNVARESYMACFSGTGLFRIDNKGIFLKGIISCEFGDRSAGNMLWASSSSLIMDVMEYFRLKQDCPKSFEPYRDMAAEEFPKIREKEMDFFINCSENLIEGHQLRPENFMDDTEIELPCEGNRNFCDDFWVGQLKKAVILHGIQGVSADKLVHPVLQMPDSCGKELVQMVYLCTEGNAESVIGELIEKEYFGKDGKMKNGTIFVLNSRKVSNLNIQFRRYECRQVLRNITKACRSKVAIEQKFHNLYTNEEGKNAKFDIIKGEIADCNLAAIGIVELMSVVNQGRADEARMKKELERILEGIWEV